MIWIQTFWHFDSVPEKYFEKDNFEKKSADGSKSVKNYPACKELMHLLMLIIMISDANFGERSGSVVDSLTRDRGAQVQASRASLCCGP